MLCVFALCSTKKNRSTIVNDILPSWDANQTWLVFTIAGLYGGFPIFFGELMSQQYSFFFVLSLLLIVRGACIEFYIKSAKFKWFWLFSLSTSSLLILACHIFLCALLISPSCFSTVPLFVIAASILWFNFTQAYCFLFFLNQYSRLILVLGLFLISTVLMYVLDVSVWQSHLTSLIFLFGVALLISFLTLSIFTCPPRWFSKILLYYLFVINVFFISQKRILNLIMLHYDELIPVTNNTSYLVINAFSMMLLPLIALGLATMKMVFYKNHNEISY
jgi:cytochrome bd-type quinol oxidase subunit 2